MDQQPTQVLMVSYVFPPIAFVGTYRTLRFCKYLPEHGIIPHVLSINKAKDLANDEQLLEQLPQAVKVYRTRTFDFWRWWRSRKGSTNQIQSGNKSQNSSAKSGTMTTKTGLLSWLKKWFWELVTMPDHMVFWVPFAVCKGASIIRQNKLELIYTTSPPHSEHLIGFFLSRIFKLPWVADFRDPMIDRMGYNPPTRLRRWVDRKLEALVVHFADKVIIISDYYKELIEQRYPLYARKLVTLPNGFDPADFDGVQPECFDKFTIIFSGTFYATISPYFFLEGFGEWYQAQTPDVQKNIQVLFYGMPLAGLADYLKEKGLADIVLTPGLIPKSQLIPKLKGADLLLLIIGFNPESKGIFTSKVFEYMATGCPILAIIPEGSASDILKTYNSWYWVDSEKHQLLRDYLDQAYAAYQGRQFSDKQTLSSDTGADRFNSKIQTAVLAGLFDECIRAVEGS